MAFSEDELRLRADLARELGYWPATTTPADIERHRRLNAALDAAPTREQISRRYAHLAEERRRSEVEARGRAEVADLYSDGLPVEPGHVVGAGLDDEDLCT